MRKEPADHSHSSLSHANAIDWLRVRGHHSFHDKRTTAARLVVAVDGPPGSLWFPVAPDVAKSDRLGVLLYGGFFGGRVLVAFRLWDEVSD